VCFAIAIVAVLGAYVRIAGSLTPDISAVSFVSASERPVCEQSREVPNATDEVVAPRLLHAARPPTDAKAGTAPRLRETASVGSCVHGGPATTVPYAALASTATITSARADSAGARRVHARVMVFLN
jgi:hypothetical protein